MSSSKKSKSSSKPISRKKTSTTSKPQVPGKVGQNGKSTGSLKRHFKAKGAYQWKNKKIFGTYLDSLKSAKRFTNEGALHFLRSLTATQRKAIYDRLRKVDPEGLKELKKLSCSLTAAKNREKKLPIKEGARDHKLEVAQAKYESEGITEFRAIADDGILDLLAMCKASGMTNKEICEKLHVEPEILSRITKEDVARIRKRMPEHIAQMADGVVYRELAEGNVPAAVAERIRTSHRKLQLDILEASRDRTPALPSEAKESEKDHKDFFDVEITDAKEVTDEDNKPG